MTTFESDRPTLLKLCWLIAEQWKAELAYSRAQYKVSYYRKLKAKLENSKKTHEKWNDHLELAKRIETERLTSLKKQKNLMDTKKRLRGPMAAARKKLEARFDYAAANKINGLSVPTVLDPAKGFHKYKQFTVDEIAEMADQYEAETILNRALSKEDKSKS